MSRADEYALTFTVHGRPAGQGAMRATRTGKVYDASKGLQTWRRAVTQAAKEAAAAWSIDHGRTWDALDCPVVVGLRFGMPRPANHYGHGRNADRLRVDAPRFPITNSAGRAAVPDIDHQVRAIFDALKDAGVFVDDSRVVKVIAEQVYTDRPRAVIVVRPYDPPVADDEAPAAALPISIPTP